MSSIRHNLIQQSIKREGNLSRQKYQVQLQCQPLTASDAEAIARSLSQSFPVTGFRCNEAAVFIDLESSFHLPYGALKDLADLVIDRATEMNLRLLSAVIQQVDLGPEAFSVESLGGRLGRMFGRTLGIKRYTPVMYFYQNMVVDLQLAARVNNRHMKPVAELN